MEDNKEWLEAAGESFEEAVAAEDWVLARNIIADVRDMSESSAKVLEERLKEYQQNI